MPYKDPEKKRENDKQRQRAIRAAKKLAPGSAIAAAVTGAARPQPVSVSAKDVNLEELAKDVMLGAGRLNQQGWLSFQGAVGLEAVGLARKALSALPITSIRDALALWEFGQRNLDRVLAATGQLGGEQDEDPDEMAAVHRAILEDPEGLAAAQKLVALRGEMLQRRNA